MTLGVNVHYEILGRRGSSWTILDVIKEREPATKLATDLWESKKYTGVRVLKESYDSDTHAFASIEIFTRGSVSKKSKYDQTGQISPCLTPDDLYSADGRRSIWDLMENTLLDWRITPTELLHSLDHYYKLYNAGTKLQNAVQRTAVSFEDEEDSIQQRMRKIYKVIDASVEIMKQNKEKIPSLEMGRLRPVIEQLEKASNKRFLLMSALVEYLRPTLTITDKFGRIAVFLSNRHPDWVNDILDQLISEFLLHPTVMEQLLGEHTNRGTYILEIAHMQTGQLSALAEKGRSPAFSDELMRLSGFLAEDILPKTSHVLFDRVRKEIIAAKPVNDGGLVEQLQALHDMQEIFREIYTDVHALDTLSEDLTARASRLINSQSISELLDIHPSPVSKVGALLDLEAAVIGMPNKRLVANFILPILSRPDNEAIFMGLDNQPIQRMNELVHLQKKVMLADLTEMHKRKIAEKLDEFCRIILDNTQVLKKLHQLDISLQEKAQKILSMMAEGYFTDGDCKMRAEHQVRIYMKQKGFTEGLIKGLGREEAEQVLLDFRKLLEQAGINKSDTDAKIES
ncbi:hypothetical protein [Kordiimonas pumila]|uniref:Flagellar motor switch protein FliG C-terminal domain-containing protein n=1 Tax=Kordiimonas pumila TaxID=2161677 RepID=A0ABV7D522_9PROT|nr:hypothetical protein [Kordiimonas pumila]